MALKEESDICMLIFVSISVPFYILFLLCILINRRKEPFNSTFFTLCLSLGVADIATLIHSYVFVKTPGWSWGHVFWVTYGSRGSFLALYSNALMWGLALAQHIGVLLIAINRFTAIALSLRHENIWSRRNISVAIALQWILPILFIIPMLSTEHKYDYWRSPDGWKYSDNVDIDFLDVNYEVAYYIAAIFINLIVNATTCGMYVAVLVIALRASKKNKGMKIGPLGGARNLTHTNDSSSQSNRNFHELNESPHISPRMDNAAPHATVPVENSHIKLNEGGTLQVEEADRKKRTQKAPNRQQNKLTAAAYAIVNRKIEYNVELRLAICGFLMFLSMLVYFIFLVCMATLGDYYGTRFVYLWYIASDVVGCISPYTLIIMSKQTRVAMKKLIQCEKFGI